MAVAFDTSVLTVLLNANARINDPVTGQPLDASRQRIEALMQSLQKKREKIVIPTPVVAEVLTVAGTEAAEYFDVIGRSSVFALVGFDTLAALELALLNREAWAAGDKRDGIDAPYQKIKIDRQILAICKVARVSTLYSGDRSMSLLAARCNLPVVALHELPIPDEARQFDLKLDPHEELPPPEPDDEPDEEEPEI